MPIAKRTDRIAFVGENITVKVARTEPLRFSSLFRAHIKARGLGHALKSLQHGSHAHSSLQKPLLHGVVANRRERRLAKSDDSVVIPTVSLLGGLVNVQPTVPTLDLTPKEINEQFVAEIGFYNTFIGHNLEDPSNFGIFNGKVRFVDGGGYGLERVLKTHEKGVRRALGAIGAQHEAMVVETHEAL